jgi:hypothetical protein
MHEHISTVQDAAAGGSGGMQQGGLQRPVNHVGHPESGMQQHRIQRGAGMGHHPGRGAVHQSISCGDQHWQLV